MRREPFPAGWTRTAAVGLAAAAVGLTATAVAGGDRAGDGGQPAPAAGSRAPLTVTSTGGAGELQPGGTVTGTLSIANPGSEPQQVTDVVFAAATADTCGATGAALAPTVPPTPEYPLEVPAGGSATLGWTAYMDGSGDHACQGQELTSEVTLDGRVAGDVTLTAGTLEHPPAPSGGLTTSSRAAVRWSATTAADPGWVLERAVAGTDDWQPACGSSAARPVRALSCTDTGLSRSTAYTYRVTLRTGHWRATSRPSEPVITQERPSA